jgi:hypothetical protein
MLASQSLLDEGRGGVGPVSPVGDDALAAAGEEERVAHLAERLPVVRVDGRLHVEASPPPAARGERRRGHEHGEAEEIHGTGGRRSREAGGRERFATVRERGGGCARSVTHSLITGSGEGTGGPTGQWPPLGVARAPADTTHQRHPISRFTPYFDQ